MLTKDEKIKQETKTAFLLGATFLFVICVITFGFIFAFNISQNTDVFAYLKSSDKLGFFVIGLTSALFFSVGNFFFKTLLSDIGVRSELKQKVSTFSLFVLIAGVVSTSGFLLKLFNL